MKNNRNRLGTFAFYFVTAGLTELLYYILRDPENLYLPCMFGFSADENVTIIMLILYMLPWITYYMVCGYRLEHEYGRHPCFLLPRLGSFRNAYWYLLKQALGITIQWAVTWGVAAGIFYITVGSGISRMFLGYLCLSAALLMITGLIFGWIHVLAVFVLKNTQPAYTVSVLVQISSIAAGTGSLFIRKYVFPNWAMLARSSFISEQGFSLIFAVAADVFVLAALFLAGHVRSLGKRKHKMDNQVPYTGKAYVTADHLSRSFHSQEVVKDVCFTMSKGTVTGLVGPNGSGKTVIMKMLCGLLSPTKGRVLIDGKQVGKDMDFPDSLGVIIENPGFINYMNGFDNLKGLARIKNTIKDDQIKEAMLRLGLDPEDKKRVGKYSLGMKQRLGIAQVIMEDPELIILDEPMNGLDKSGVQLVRKLILDLKGKNKCILLASHNMEDIRILCDVVYEIDQNTIVLWDENR